MTASGLLETSCRVSVHLLGVDKRKLKTKVSELDMRMQPMNNQRQDLETIATIINQWTKALHNAERGTTGIPVLNSVKQICMPIDDELADEKSELRIVTARLYNSDVPCIREIEPKFEQIQKLLEAVFADESRYNGKLTEDVRYYLGEIKGVVSALLELFYET